MIDENKYPHEVLLIKELVNGIDIKETHISYVILTEDYVYKIKKSIDFGFLNYTNAKDRRLFCVLEKELNNRFSKGIYQEVLKLCRKDQLVYSLEPIESSLYALEYILKMKRIADDDFLPNRITKGEITDEMMINIGAEVAKLLSSLDNADLESLEDPKSNYDTVRYNATENFNQTEMYVDKFINRELYDYIKTGTFNFLDKHKAIFNIRYLEGYVKNGHGDLRLEHIYFNSDGTVGLIDCIEFNKRFRYNDIISEAAFLSMELDINSMGKYADFFLKGFLSIINDDISLQLLNYYRSYLAYVRAKVTLFLLSDKDETWEFYNQKVAEVRKLIIFSAHYLSSALHTKTFLFYGLMGSGKSKNAKTFADNLPVKYLSSDETRKQLAGIDIQEKIYLDYNKGIYSKETSYNVYLALAKMVNENLSIGRVSIIDASFSNPEYYNIVKSEVRSDLFKVLFTAPDDIIYKRLNERLTKDSISDGRPELYEEQKRSSNFPKEDITVITTKDISENIKQIFFAYIK